MATYDKSIKYSLELFAAMNAKASMVDPRTVPHLRLTSITTPIRLFHGTLAKLARELGFTQRLVYNAAGLLYRVQAVTKLAHSHPLDDGWWIINFEPTYEQLTKFIEDSRVTSRKIAPSRLDVILSDFANLRSRVRELENLMGAFSELEARVKELENSIGGDNLRRSSTLS